MEVTVKKFLFITLFCLGINIMPMGYIPAQGPLILGDSLNPTTRTLNRGYIMDTLINNLTFGNELVNISNFLNLSIGAPITQTYQEIIQLVKQSTNTNASILVIEAFENIIMHKYNYDAYCFGNYTPGRSIFFNGIRYSWLNPLSYINPKSWLSDNNLTLDQLISELENLSQIAQSHSFTVSKRLALTAHSYRYWRQYLLYGLIAYLSIDITHKIYNESSFEHGIQFEKGFKKTTLHSFHNKGLLGGSFEIIKQSFSNTKDVTCFIGSTLISSTKAGYKNYFKPTCIYFLNGATELEKLNSKNKSSITQNTKELVAPTTVVSPAQAPAQAQAPVPVPNEKHESTLTPKRSLRNDIGSVLSESEKILDLYYSHSCDYISSLDRISSNEIEEGMKSFILE